MRARGLSVRIAAAVATVIVLSAVSFYAVFGAASAWPTYQHDIGRGGLDPNVGQITSVSASWNSQLDAKMYAQPLTAGSVVYAATENNTIYALDANSGAVVWKRTLAAPARLNQLPCGNIDPYGITGTPVIDTATGVLYTAALVSSPSIHHELYALDLNNAGAVLYHFGIDASGSDPTAQGQRGALTLANGKVYVPFSGRWGDCGNYTGRVVGVNTGDSTGASKVSYSLPNTARGGIWAAASADSTGNLYVATGNSNATGSTPDRGESVVKLSPSLQELDYFTAPEWRNLNSTDTDIGSIGPMPLQNGWILQSGKNAMGYLINSASMGHVGGQLFEAQICDSGDEALAFGAYLPPSTVFIPCTTALKAVHVNTGNATFTVTTVRGGYSGDPGTSPPIIAGGVLWNLDTGANLLLGFDPNTGQQLFSQALSGTPAHFVAPSSGAGHLFVPTGSMLEAFSLSSGGNPTPTNTATATATATRTATPVPNSTATPTPTPTAGGSGMTTVGLTSPGSQADSGDRQALNGSKVVVGAQSLGVISISAYIGAVDAAPNNQFAFGIYTDAGGAPGSLVAQSGASTLQANSWNTISMGATLQANTAYWLMYNTNASSPAFNNLYYNNDPGMVGAYNSAQTFGTWPSSFGPATMAGTRYSIYATGTAVAPAGATATPTATPTATSTVTPTSVATVAPLGLTTVGGSQDTGNRNNMTGSRVTTSAQGMSVTSISAYVGPVDASPNNQFSLAIYADAGGAPGARVAQSAVGTLQANSWNTLSISARLNPNTSYWLFYNTNGTNRVSNDLAYNNDPSPIGAYAVQTFGTWPGTYGPASLVGARYSIYASGTR